MVKDSDRVEGIWLGRNSNTIMVWFEKEYYHSSKNEMFKRVDAQTNKLMRETWGHEFLGPLELVTW
jgi:hypothetical protein